MSSISQLSAEELVIAGAKLFFFLIFLSQCYYLLHNTMAVIMIIFSPCNNPESEGDHKISQENIQPDINSQGIHETKNKYWKLFAPQSWMHNAENLITTWIIVRALSLASWKVLRSPGSWRVWWNLWLALWKKNSNRRWSILQKISNCAEMVQFILLWDENSIESLVSAKNTDGGSHHIYIQHGKISNW